MQLDANTLKYFDAKFDAIHAKIDGVKEETSDAAAALKEHVAYARQRDDKIKTLEEQMNGKNGMPGVEKMQLQIVQDVAALKAVAHSPDSCQLAEAVKEWQSGGKVIKRISKPAFVALVCIAVLLGSDAALIIGKAILVLFGKV